MTSREKSDFTKWITLLVFIFSVLGGMAGFGISRGMELAKAEEMQGRVAKAELAIHTMQLADRDRAKDLEYIKESVKEIKQALGVKP